MAISVVETNGLDVSWRCAGKAALYVGPAIVIEEKPAEASVWVLRREEKSTSGVRGGPGLRRCSEFLA